MVTIRMFRNMPTVSISIMAPAVSCIRSGVITGASTVEAHVIPTEKATSP